MFTFFRGVYFFTFPYWGSFKNLTSTGLRAPISWGAQRLLLSFSCLVVSGYLWPHGLQDFRLPYASLSPRVCSSSCLLNQWRHPTISSSAIPFSFCLQSFIASGSFPMSQLFASGGQRTGASASASVLPMNIQDWSPLGLTGLISLQSKRLSRVFSTPQFKSINSLSFLHN